MALETPNLGHTVCVNQVSAGNTDSQRAFRPYIDLGQTKTWANKGGMNALYFTTQFLFMQKGSEGVCFGLCKNRREDLGSRVGKGGGDMEKGGILQLAPPLKIGNSKGTIEFPR